MLVCTECDILSVTVLPRHMLAREDPYGLLGRQGRSFSDLASQPLEAKVLRELLQGTLVEMNTEGDLKQQALSLLRSGLLLLADDGSFRFLSPLHRWHYEKQVGWIIRTPGT